MKNNFIFIKKYKDFIKNITTINIYPRNKTEIIFNKFLQADFVRIKFLLLGLEKEIKSQNAFSSYSILKALYESVATFSYSVIRYQEYKKTDNYGEILKLSKKMLLGGRSYKKIAHVGENYLQPRFKEIFSTVDRNFAKEIKEKLGQNVKDLSLKEDYYNIIAESGHPTFLGLWTSIFFDRKNESVNQIKINLNRSWNIADEKTISIYFEKICLYLEHYLNIPTLITLGI